MVLFDRFKKKNINVEPEVKKEPPTFEVKYSITSDGKLQVDFHDLKKDFKQFYDTTRLIVDTNSAKKTEDSTVYDCLVSWYEERYEVLKKVGDSLRALDYKDILAELDLDLLQNDEKYCKMVIKSLINEKRVERYLETGLQEEPELPCGKYVGGIFKTEKGYEKLFDPDIGKKSHNSLLMRNKRCEHREMIRASRQREIDEKNAQIEKLQNEIDDLYR